MSDCKVIALPNRSTTEIKERLGELCEGESDTMSAIQQLDNDAVSRLSLLSNKKLLELADSTLGIKEELQKFVQKTADEHGNLLILNVILDYVEDLLELHQHRIPEHADKLIMLYEILYNAEVKRVILEATKEVTVNGED